MINYSRLIGIQFFVVVVVFRKKKKVKNPKIKVFRQELKNGNLECTAAVKSVQGRFENKPVFTE